MLGQFFLSPTGDVAHPQLPPLQPAAPPPREPRKNLGKKRGDAERLAELECPLQPDSWEEALAVRASRRTATQSPGRRSWRSRSPRPSGKPTTTPEPDTPANWRTRQWIAPSKVSQVGVLTHTTRGSPRRRDSARAAPYSSAGEGPAVWCCTGLRSEAARASAIAALASTEGSAARTNGSSNRFTIVPP